MQGWLEQAVPAPGSLSPALSGPTFRATDEAQKAWPSCSGEHRPWALSLDGHSLPGPGLSQASRSALHKLSLKTLFSVKKIEPGYSFSQSNPCEGNETGRGGPERWAEEQNELPQFSPVYGPPGLWVRGPRPTRHVPPSSDTGKPFALLLQPADRAPAVPCRNPDASHISALTASKTQPPPCNRPSVPPRWKS